METKNTPELATAVSKEFSKLLSQYLSVNQLEQIRILNRDEKDDNICHTHDFLDANEVMAEAFEAVTGHEMNIQDDSNLELWNIAWKEAKFYDFYNGY